MNKLHFSLRGSFLVIFLLLAGQFVFAQTSYYAVIGTDTADPSIAVGPVYRNHKAFRYQTVYTAAELNAAGLTAYDKLVGLGFSISVAPSLLKHYTIRIGHTASVTASNPITDELITVREAADYSPDQTSSGSFDMINFDSGAFFIWNGTNNIVIEICTHDNQATNPYSNVFKARSHSFSNASRFRIGNSSTSLCDLNISNTNDFRPQIRFRYHNGSTPSCAAPTGLTASNHTYHSMDLSWTGGGTFDINWGEGSFVAGEGATIAGFANGGTLSGLTMGTPYSYYVRSNCGAESSIWAGPYNFTIPIFGTDKLPVSSCNSFGDPASAGSDLNYNYNNHAYSQLIYTASEVGTLLSPGSTYITKIGFKQIKLPDSGTENYRHWKIALVNTPKSSFSGPISANDWIYYSQFTEVFSGAVDNNTTGWIEIPLDVPFVWDEESNLAIAIYKMSSGGECDSNGGGARWESYNAESFRGQSCNSTSGTQQQQYPPAIHYRTSEIPTLLLEGTPVPDCFKPFGLTVTNITRHTADFTWEEGAENTQSFSWFIFADNADPETATPLFSGTTASSSETVSGMTAETPYDFYVKANCGSEDGMSAFSLKKDFTTAIACPAPTDLTAYDATQNTVTLSWASQSSSLFDIEWGEGSFEQGSGTMISNHSGTTYPLTGLQPATTYSYYVRGNCGSPYGLSFWSGPYSFITAEMGQIGGGLSSTSLPGASEYNYNYSQQIYLASELNTVITSGTYISKIRFRHNWVPPMFIAYLSEAFMDWKIYMGSTSKTAFDSTTDWIPLSQLSQVFSGTIAFTADFEQQALWIEITLTNPFPWDGVSNLVVAIDENSPGSYTSGTFVSSFASFTAGSNRGIMYSGSSNANPASPPVATYGPSNNIAKIKLTTINCPVPTNLNAAYTSDDAIAFSWTSNSSLFDIEWGEGSFEQGSGTMVTAHSGTSYEITGVQPDTTYSYYVRGNCGAAGQSDWAGPYSFAPGYIGINSDTGQGNLPVYSTHNYNYSQMIYRADELSAVLAPGETYITKISFYQLVVPSSGTENYQQWEVSLANTTKTSFTSPTNWVGYSNFTQVFSGSVDNNTVGWVEIIFDIPFIWDGVSNLAISVREQSPGSSSSTAQWAAYDTGVVRGLRHSGSGGGHEAYAANDSTGNYSQQPKPANFSTTLMPQLLVEATTVPDCLPPDASLTGVTNHTASFIWEGQDNNLSYSWVIVADNADPETATPLFSGMVTASSVTVSDLPAETQYDFYVKADCGAEDGTSIYSMRVDFITATACATPTSLTAGSIAQNEATLSWTSEASLFDIEWGEAFFEQGSGTMINNHSGTTYLLNGLQPGIVYHYYVRSNCGGGDGFSLWAGPYSFETSEEDQIGGGAAVANFPVNSAYDYNYSQQIYFASDLTSALDSGPAYISKIRFRHNDVFPYYTGDDIGSSYANWRVYLGNTSKAVFSSNTDWVPLSQLTQVFSGTLTFEAYSWVEITLANPFVWDGVSNLVVAIDENSPESIDPIYFQFQASFASFNAGTNRGIMASGSTNINPASPPAATYGPSATISQIQLTKISCPVPINLNVNFTIDTATLSWTSNTPSFDIEWGEGSFEQGNGTMVTAHNGTTYTLPEFQPSVSYSYYVRGNCGSDGQSDWAGPFSFTTPLPGYIGFGSASSNGLPINSCLTRSYSQLIYRASELNAMLVPGEHYITKIGFKQTELPDTGTENYRKWRVAFANTTKASFSAFNNWLGSGNFIQVFLGNVDTSVLGWVEITLDTPFLWDGVSNLAISISEETPDSNCNLGSTFGALWASYNGGGYRGMLGRGNSGNNAMAQQEGSSGNSIIQPGIFRSTNIPQLMVEMVGCPEPINLNAVISVESATLSWTGGGSLFDIEWGEGSFEPGNGTMINGYTGSTYEISGLQPSTTYNYYVRRDCGENGTSDWAGPYSFTTATPSQIGEGDGFYRYPVRTKTNIWAAYNYSQQLYLASELNTVLSPENTTITGIRFKVIGAVGAYNTYNNWTVYLGNTSKAVFGNNTDWVPASGLTQVFSGIVTFTADAWMTVVFDTPFVWDGTSNLVVAVDENSSGNDNYTGCSFAAFDSGTNRGLIYTGNTNVSPASPLPASYATVDSEPDTVIAQIRIMSVEPTSCYPPVNLAVSDITFNSVTLSWQGSGVSTDVSFDIVWGETGFLPQTEENLITGLTDTSYILSELTQYTEYQFYVRSHCEDGTSAWSEPYTFYTDYCGATGSNLLGSGNITKFVFAGIDNSSSSTTGYEDFTSLRAEVQADGSYSFTLVRDGGFLFGSTVLYPVKIGVDFNQNGVFESDEGEIISYPSNNNPNYTGTINIPATALLGETRIRIVLTKITTGGGGGPSPFNINSLIGNFCGDNDTGEVEDYTINILPPGAVWTADNNWLNNIEPDITKDVTVLGSLMVGGITDSFSAKTLTISPGGNIGIDWGKSVTVQEAIINQADVTDFVINNNGVLIQIDDEAVNTGGVVVRRESSPMFRLDYTIWGSPVEGMLLKDFSEVSPSGGYGTLWNRVYTLGETAWEQVWATQPNLDSDTTEFETATGYLYRAKNDWVTRDSGNFAEPYQGEFAGVPNNGEISIATPYMFNSIGNPYPSPIDAYDFISGNAGVDVIYFWTNVNPPVDESYDGINNWAYYNLAGGTGVQQMGGDEEELFEPGGIIQSGQGFVVHTEETTSSVVFNNAMRSTENDIFFKQMTAEKHRFWLNLSNEAAIFNQILIGYIENATQGVDTGIDAKMFGYEGNALYSLIENSEENYVIQGRALPFTDSDIVPLGFRAVNAGSFSISLDNLDGTFEDGNTTIYLKDNLNQVQHNLNEGAYAFLSQEGVFDTRFEVIYHTATMSTETPLPDITDWIIFKQGNGFQIQTQGFDMKEVSVFDMLGRKIYTSEAEGTTHHLPNFEAESVYIVKVTTTEDKVLNKKVR